MKTKRREKDRNECFVAGITSSRLRTGSSRRTGRTRPRLVTTSQKTWHVAAQPLISIERTEKKRTRSRWVKN